MWDDVKEITSSFLSVSPVNINLIISIYLTGDNINSLLVMSAYLDTRVYLVCDGLMLPDSALKAPM